VDFSGAGGAAHDHEAEVLLAADALELVEQLGLGVGQEAHDLDVHADGSAVQDTHDARLAVHGRHDLDADSMGAPFMRTWMRPDCGMRRS